MATFKTLVRRKRADGLYPVYIRVVHRTKAAYIPTGKVVSEKQLSKDKKEIKDPVVNEFCSNEILRYNNLANLRDLTYYTTQEVVEYLTKEQSEVCFSDY